MEKTLLKDKIFSLKDIAETRGIARDSASVWLVRAVHRGEILRLKKDLYIHAMDWKYLSLEEMLLLSNRIQIPSYISLSTAMAYYERTSQVYRNVIESIAIKRSVAYSVNNTQFKYYKIKKEYYTQFEKISGLFIATPEKALADIIYLCSLGKYAFDFNAVEWGRVDSNKLVSVLGIFPVKTQKWWEKHGFVSPS